MVTFEHITLTLYTLCSVLSKVRSPLKKINPILFEIIGLPFDQVYLLLFLLLLFTTVDKDANSRPVRKGMMIFPPAIPLLWIQLRTTFNDKCLFGQNMEIQNRPRSMLLACSFRFMWIQLTHRLDTRQTTHKASKLSTSLRILSNDHYLNFGLFLYSTNKS